MRPLADHGLFVSQCESTQDLLRTQRQEGIRWVVTAHQTRGRGRRGRTWVSPKGAGLSLSWLVPPQHPLTLDQIPAIPLASGVAVARWLEKWNVKISLKWPNDLYIDNQKLGGILCEAEHSSHQPPSGQDSALSICVGIGINLYTHPQLPQGAIALDQLFDQKPSHTTPLSQDLITLGRLLKDELELAYLILCQEGWLGVIQAWREYELPHGTPLMQKTAQETLYGCYQGIDSRGSLKLSSPEHGQILISTGEVSLYSPPPSPLINHDH